MLAIVIVHNFILAHPIPLHPSQAAHRAAHRVKVPLTHDGSVDGIGRADGRNVCDGRPLDIFLSVDLVAFDKLGELDDLFAALDEAMLKELARAWSLSLLSQHHSCET